jgi:AraC-like DNA-binding protein
VARRSGFRDAKHFNRVFKQHRGTTPLAYRAEHRHRPRESD